MRLKPLFTKIIITIGIVILIIASFLFVYINKAIISNAPLLLIALLLILVLMLVVTSIKANIIKIDKKKLRWLDLTITVISLGSFIMIVLNSLVINYFQPLALSTLVSVLFIVGMIITLPIIFNAVKLLKVITSLICLL